MRKTLKYHEIESLSSSNFELPKHDEHHKSRTNPSGTGLTHSRVGDYKGQSLRTCENIDVSLSAN